MSDEERQQLVFARALLARLKLTMLDEATAARSPALVAQTFAAFVRQPALGVTMLVFEQRARRLQAVSTRGSILEGSKLGLVGPATTLKGGAAYAETDFALPPDGIKVQLR